MNNWCDHPRCNLLRLYQIRIGAYMVLTKGFQEFVLNYKHDQRRRINVGGS